MTSQTPNWEIRRLGDICEVIAGQSPPSDTYRYVPEGLPFYQGKADFGKIFPVPRVWCVKPHKVAQAGDVLISVRAPVGPTNIAGTDCCIGRGLAAIRGKSAIDQGFLLHTLRFLENDIARLGSGSTFKAITTKDLSNLSISVPSLIEQRRIAAILDKADSLREKRRQAIAKLNELLQSVFIEMFGDPKTNPKGWPVGSIEMLIKEKSDLRCGPFGTQLKVGELVGSGIPLFGIENVLNNQFVSTTAKFLTKRKASELSAFSIQPGDVLVTRMGTIGRACVVPRDIKEGRISYHLFRVRPDPAKCLPEFLASTICRSGTFQAQLRTLSHGAIMAGLSTGDLKAVKFLTPPISLQEKYVTLVSTIERVIDKEKESLEKLEALFSSIQQRAFSGELFTDKTQSTHT